MPFATFATPLTNSYKMEIFSITDLIEYLENNKGFLHESFGVTRLGIFGSFAEERQTILSDIDMLVEFEKGKKNIHNFLDLKRFLENKLSRKVDLGFEHSLKPIVRENVKDRVIYV